VRVSPKPVRGRRIEKAFAKAAQDGRAALVVFVEAGDPDLETTERLVPALAEAGADVIELGVAFSDPIADGPTIQRASERALAAGASLTRTLELAARLRAAGVEVPLVLFSYANPVLAMGEAEFAHRASVSGIDGVLVTDLPPEAGRPFASILKSAGLDPVYLLAPTSPDARIRRAASLSRGFVYLVSRAGVTGVRADLPEGLDRLVARVKKSVSRLPIAVGFGISTPEQVRQAAALTEGVVVGSAVVSSIESAVESNSDPVGAAATLVRSLRAATVRSRG
jgi:tryptophan synthase alpha chain